MRVFQRRLRPEVAFPAAMVLLVAGLAVWDWVVVVLAAPWVAAVAWLFVRFGAKVVVATDEEAFPSAAEAARRRLAAR